MKTEIIEVPAVEIPEAVLKGGAHDPTAEVIKTMGENYETLKATTDAMTSDFEKFNAKKIKVAGQRVRSDLLNCKKLCDKLRKQILADIKALPIKHRKGTVEEEGKDYVNPPTPPESSEDDKADSTADEIPEPLELKRETTEAPVKEKKVRKPRRANKKKEEKKT